jgi:predicted nucleotide-binding protein (sugar kinase/HSP70/actin superfamily)
MGEKPYLILELDEHSAVAGLLTRIEAYRNVVKTVHAKRFGDRVEPAEPAPAFSCLR